MANTSTTMYKVGEEIGTEMKSLLGSINTLTTQVTGLESKTADAIPKPNAEFFRYAPNVSLNPKVKFKCGETATSVHVYLAKRQMNLYFHLEWFMARIIVNLFPDVWVSPTLKLEIGDMGRVMAYGKFYDKSGTFTHSYDMGNIYIQMCEKAADNIPDESKRHLCYTTTAANAMLHPEHPIVRSEGNTTTQVGTEAECTVDNGWVQLYNALYCIRDENSTVMDYTLNGKWAADLMKCWTEMGGVWNTGSNPYKLYQAWKTLILQVCQEFDPTFTTLVFSNRAGTPNTPLTGAPARFV